MTTRSKPRRLWDSSVIIGYLAGQDDLAEACTNIIDGAERGELDIVVSTIAMIEVAYLRGFDDEDSEMKIRELFSRDYIIPVALDTRVSAIARGLVRKYREGPKINPPDAGHLATAMQWQVPLLETTDPDLLRLDGREGDPKIIIREPMYNGPQRLTGFE